jgi:predicted nuclease with TOPRIM domain
MNEMDQKAIKRIQELEEENEALILLNDVLQTTLEESEEALKALKGQYALLLRDYKVADVG